MAIIFTPDYFKTEFRNGKSIRQIAKENYVTFLNSTLLRSVLNDESYHI